MITTAISIILFGNFLALFFMWMCGTRSNIHSRSDREIRILQRDNKDKN